MIKFIGFIYDIAAIIFLFLLIFSTDKQTIIEIGIPIWITQLILTIIRKLPTNEIKN